MDTHNSKVDEPEAEYVFKRDYKSSVRLNYLHGLVVKLMGSLVHPSIPAIKEMARVADIATGTAIWPIELSQQLPSSVRIDGFDISAAQYPHASHLPPNVHLHLHDCWQTFASTFRGQFDVVFIRFVVVLANKANLRALVENLSTLLKPGGFIQWVEPDNAFAEVISPGDEGVAHPATTRLSELIKKPTPAAQTEWVDDLVPTLEEAGFHQVKRMEYPVPAALRPFFHLVHLMSYEDVQEKAALAPHAAADGHSLLQLQREFHVGVVVGWAFLCATARKS